MKRRDRQISIFNLSMLDVMAGAMGVFLSIAVILLPYYKKDVVAQIEQLEQQLSDAEAQIEAARDSLQNAQVQATAAEDSAQALSSELAQAEARGDSLAQAIDRLGFTISEKAVFVVDVSGSMAPERNDYNENRIEQVKAGLKMLLATMDTSYKIDIVYFPKNTTSGTETYGYWQRRLTTMRQDVKYDAYRFIESIKPGGGTPTGSTMKFVLSEYDDAETIVLLSDGEPCMGPIENMECGLEERELNSIVDDLTGRNNGRVRINTIGIGHDFRNLTTISEAKEFLKELANKNGGFFVGF